MSIDITVKDKKFNKQLEKLAKTHGKQLNEALVGATLSAHKFAVNKAPVDEGSLKQQIGFDILKGGFTGEIESKAPYSAAVEEGTKPHKIEIKKKKVLAGKGVSGNSNSGGWSIWGTKVQHPGTKPQPFMYPAFIVGKKRLEQLIKRLF